MQSLGKGWMRPDSAHTPENYGFNAIKMALPQSGQSRVAVDFRALSDLGYRYGWVGVTQDGRCLYSKTASKSRGTLVFQLPKNTPLKALYLIVMGAPSSHDLDPSSRQFPYEIKVK